MKLNGIIESISITCVFIKSNKFLSDFLYIVIRLRNNKKHTNKSKIDMNNNSS